MTYTTIDFVSYELNNLTIDSSSIPSSTAVIGWIDDADSEINLRTGKIWSSTTASSVLLDYDGTGFLKLPFTPVISITSLEYEENGLGASSTSWKPLTEGRTEDYISYVMDGEVEFFGSSKPPKGYQNIRITYVYGYANTPAYISRLATLIVAKRVIAATINKSSQGEGGSVTVGNISITDPSNFSVGYIQNIGTEINDIYKRIGTSKIFVGKRHYDMRY